MGSNSSVPKVPATLANVSSLDEPVRANDLARFNETNKGANSKQIKTGWLCKTGLNNTTLQRRWCAIHDLKLFYFENPRSEEANGFVNLRGAIVTESKRLPQAFEIHTGALFADRGMEKRVFTFTPVGADERKNSRQALDPEQKEAERKKNKIAVKEWMKCIQKESAKAFLPS